jgi:hypothetical protein
LIFIQRLANISVSFYNYRQAVGRTSSSAEGTNALSIGTVFKAPFNVSWHKQ